MDTALILFAFGFFLLGLAAVIYVAFRFASLVISMDAAILREFKGQGRVVVGAVSRGAVTEDKLKDFIKARMSPTEGDYVPHSDEEAFISEQVDHLRRQGLTDDELDAFVRQAVGSDVGSPGITTG